MYKYGKKYENQGTHMMWRPVFTTVEKVNEIVLNNIVVEETTARHRSSIIIPIFDDIWGEYKVNIFGVKIIRIINGSYFYISGWENSMGMTEALDPFYRSVDGKVVRFKSDGTSGKRNIWTPPPGEVLPFCSNPAHNNERDCLAAVNTWEPNGGRCRFTDGSGHVFLPEFRTEATCLAGGQNQVGQGYFWISGEEGGNCSDPLKNDNEQACLDSPNDWIRPVTHKVTGGCSNPSHDNEADCIRQRADNWGCVNDDGNKTEAACNVAGANFHWVDDEIGCVQGRDNNNEASCDAEANAHWVNNEIGCIYHSRDNTETNCTASYAHWVGILNSSEENTWTEPVQVAILGGCSNSAHDNEADCLA